MRTVSDSVGCKMSSMRENNPSYKMSSYSSAPTPPSSQIIIGPSLSLVKHAQTITLTRALLKVFFTYFRLSLSPGDDPLPTWIDTNPYAGFVQPNNPFPVFDCPIFVLFGPF